MPSKAVVKYLMKMVKARKKKGMKALGKKMKEKSKAWDMSKAEARMSTGKTAGEHLDRDEFTKKRIMRGKRAGKNLNKRIAKKRAGRLPK